MKLLNLIHSTNVHPRRVHVLSSEISRLVREGDRILDIGSGDGFLGKLISEKSGSYVEGIDILVRKDAQIKTSLFDGSHIFFEDQSFDGAVIVDVLHHVEHPEVILKEAIRISKQYIIIKDHLNNSKLDGATLRFMDWFGNAHHNVVLPFNYLSMQEWVSLFETLNLATPEFTTSLNLYAGIFNLIFGRNLHFIARLDLK